MYAFKRLPVIVKIALLASIVGFVVIAVPALIDPEGAQPSESDFTPTRFVTAIFNPPTVTVAPTITAGASQFEIIQTFAPLSVATLPTAAATSLPAEVTITQTRESKGEYLLIIGGGYNYKLGPYAEGLYAIGPNKRFLVYVTDNAEVYAGKFGTTTLVKLAKLTIEFPGTLEESPLFNLSFHDNGYSYTLVIREKKYNSRNSVILPRSITHD